MWNYSTEQQKCVGSTTKNQKLFADILKCSFQNIKIRLKCYTLYTVVYVQQISKISHGCGLAVRENLHSTPTIRV